MPKDAAIAVLENDQAERRGEAHARTEAALQALKAKRDAY